MNRFEVIEKLEKLEVIKDALYNGIISYSVYNHYLIYKDYLAKKDDYRFKYEVLYYLSDKYNLSKAYIDEIVKDFLNEEKLGKLP